MTYFQELPPEPVRWSLLLEEEIPQVLPVRKTEEEDKPTGGGWVIFLAISTLFMGLVLLGFTGITGLASQQTFEASREAWKEVDNSRKQLIQAIPRVNQKPVKAQTVKMLPFNSYLTNYVSAARLTFAGFVLAVVAVVLLILSSPYFICGLGLIWRRSWARTMAFILTICTFLLGVVFLVGIAHAVQQANLGNADEGSFWVTVICALVFLGQGIVTWVILLPPGVQQLFQKKPEHTNPYALRYDDY